MVNRVILNLRPVLRTFCCYCLEKGSQVRLSEIRCEPKQFIYFTMGLYVQEIVDPFVTDPMLQPGVGADEKLCQTERVPVEDNRRRPEVSSTGLNSPRDNTKRYCLLIPGARDPG